jgi:hypothetical protein
MRIAPSFGVAAAVGIFLTATASGFAWDFHAQHVTAAANPAPATGESATPATTVDPVTLASLERAVILPSTPKEEDAAESAAAD